MVNLRDRQVFELQAQMCSLWLNPIFQDKNSDFVTWLALLTELPSLIRQVDVNVYEEFGQEEQDHHVFQWERNMMPS